MDFSMFSSVFLILYYNSQSGIKVSDWLFQVYVIFLHLIANQLISSSNSAFLICFSIKIMTSN